MKNERRSSEEIKRKKELRRLQTRREQDLLLSASIEQDVSLDDERFKASGKFSINIFKQKARSDRKIRARSKMSISLVFFFFLRFRCKKK